MESRSDLVIMAKSGVALKLLLMIEERILTHYLRLLSQTTIMIAVLIVAAVLKLHTSCC